MGQSACSEVSKEGQDAVQVKATKAKGPALSVDTSAGAMQEQLQLPSASPVNLKKFPASTGIALPPVTGVPEQIPESADIQRLRQELKSKEQALEQVEKSVASHAALIKALEQEAFQKDEVIGKLRASEAAHREVATLVAELRKKDNEIDAMRRRAASEEATLQSLTAEAQTKGDVIEDLTFAISEQDEKGNSDTSNGRRLYDSTTGGEITLEAGAKDVIISAPSEANAPTVADNTPTVEADAPSVAGLRIIQVTDVYTLENFPALKTMIAEKRAEAQKQHMDTISMLTGDFLAPYLLSSIDRGKGMMTMINETPIDYLTWGNHDGNDMSADAVREREAEYTGVWVNSNMTGHETFAHSHSQVDRAEIEVCSPDESNVRKIGFCGILSNSPDLYKPGAFNGAKIEDPWECMATYNRILKEEDGCDLVIPLCHLYEPQDERTCREFDFPLILSGHDHHVVDKVVEGTRLLKPGQDARKAHIVDIKWASSHADCKPTIEVETVDVTKYDKDPELLKKSEEAYKVLDRLTHTELCGVDDQYRPLTSFGSRNRHVTMGTFMCSKIRDALNAGADSHVDCVIMKGANIRGGTDYPDNSKFTLQSLLSETQEEHEVFLFKVPGSCIKVGLRETWQHAGPGWFQYSNDVVVDDEGLVTHVAGEPIDESRLYSVGSIKDLSRVADGPTIGNYLQADASRIPSPDAGHPVRPLLLRYFAEQCWNQMFKKLDKRHRGRVSVIDIKEWDEDGDGTLDKHELKGILRNSSYLDTSEEEDAFIDVILEVAGGHGGRLTLDELNKKHSTESLPDLPKEVPSATGNRRQSITRAGIGKKNVRKSVFSPFEDEQPRSRTA